MTKPISKWILIRAFVLTAVVFSLLTEVNSGGGDSNCGEIDSEKAPRISERTPNGEVSKTLLNNPADMKFNYKRRKGFRGSASKRSALVSERAVYRVVWELKKRVALPFDIQVVFKECAGPDSYYDEDTR